MVSSRNYTLNSWPLTNLTAFDSLGRHYDLHGNYTDWWDNETVSAFEKKAECFVDQ